jgi:hypothetical protein
MPMKDNRFGHAMYLLRVARQTPCVQLKIWSYASIIEELFSIQGETFDHRVQYAAKLLGRHDDFESLKAILTRANDFKTSFESSSLYLPTTEEINLSRELDEFLREILLEIIYTEAKVFAKVNALDSEFKEFFQGMK